MTKYFAARHQTILGVLTKQVTRQFRTEALKQH